MGSDVGCGDTGAFPRCLAKDGTWNLYYNIPVTQKIRYKEFPSSQWAYLPRFEPSYCGSISSKGRWIVDSIRGLYKTPIGNNLGIGFTGGFGLPLVIFEGTYIDFNNNLQQWIAGILISNPQNLYLPPNEVFLTTEIIATGFFGDDYNYSTPLTEAQKQYIYVKVKLNGVYIGQTEIIKFGAIPDRRWAGELISRFGKPDIVLKPPSTFSDNTRCVKKVSDVTLTKAWHVRNGTSSVSSTSAYSELQTTQAYKLEALIDNTAVDAVILANAPHVVETIADDFLTENRRKYALTKQDRADKFNLDLSSEFDKARMKLMTLGVLEYEADGHKRTKAVLQLGVSTEEVMNIKSSKCSNRHPSICWSCEEEDKCPPNTCLRYKCCTSNKVCCYDSRGRLLKEVSEEYEPIHC